MKPSEAGADALGGCWRGVTRLVLQQASALLAALQFLTIFPPVVRRPFEAAEMGAAVGYFPLVGLGLGAVLAGLSWLLVQFLPASVGAVLVLAVWEILTGAIHLDGFLDSCDGLLGGCTVEHRLRILRDHNIGAYAMSGGVFLILTRYASLLAVTHVSLALLLAPVCGRWAVGVAVWLFPYARPEGLGRTFKDHATRAQAVLASAIALIAVWSLAGDTGLAALFVSGVVGWATGRFALARLPGLTGDVYGAICELSETASLLLLASRWVQ